MRTPTFDALPSSWLPLRTVPQAVIFALALFVAFWASTFWPAALAEEGPSKQGDDYASLATRATAAYVGKKHELCGELYDRAGAVAPSRRQATALYNAACCWALAGEKAPALASLEAAVAAGLRGPKQLEADKDLASLREDPRWESLVERITANQERFAKQHNGELLRMYEEDQADRGGGIAGIDWEQVSRRDEARRVRVRELLKAGEVRSAEDYFHAAMVFQHGSEADDYRSAHELAKKAAELDPEHTTARWLSAAAWDRYLHRTGKPQIYGTQFRKGDDGRWTLEPLDAEAVTDQERLALGVPPLAQARERAKAMNSGG